MIGAEKKQVKLPDHYMYDVNEGKNGKGHFTKIAAGWNNKDGEGVNWIWRLQPNDKTVSRTRQFVESMKEKNAQQQPKQEQSLEQ